LSELHQQQNKKTLTTILPILWNTCNIH